MSKSYETSFYKSPDSIPFKLRVMQWYLKILSYIWPQRAAKQLVNLFVHPRTDREAILGRYEELNIFTHGTQKTINLEGNELFIYEEGIPQVLLVTGWESSAHRFVTLIERFRKEGIGFLYFDLPGQAHSEGSTNHAVKTARIVRDLALRYPTITNIVGHSFGGGASFLSLQEEFSTNNYQQQLDRIITVGSPTRYKSVITPFLTFLDIPSHMEEKFIRAISDYVGMDFARYDWATLHEPAHTAVFMIHDKDDHTIPVSDATRMLERYQIHLTEGLGHRKIMHDPSVIDLIVEILKQPLPRISQN